MEFKVLLRYLEGLQGNQRGIVVDRAQQLLEGYDRSQENGKVFMDSL